MLFDNNRKIVKVYYKNDLGVFKKGVYVDVIVVDYILYILLIENIIGGYIIFGMSGRSVDIIIISGKVFMKDRKLINIDEESILVKSRELS